MEVERGRDGRLQLRDESEDAVHCLDHVGAGLAEYGQQDCRLAVREPCVADVFHGIYDVSNGLEPHRRAISPGDNQRAVFPRPEKLIRGAYVPGIPGVRQLALRPIGIRGTQRRAHGVEADSVAIELGRIHLNAHRRARASPNKNLADAFDLRKLLGEDRVCSVINSRSGNVFRGQAEQEDRRVGGIHFSVIRLRRQAGGELAAGGIDGGLNVPGGSIYVAAQVELKRDVGRAELAGGRHLCHTGDVAELALERRGH